MKYLYAILLIFLCVTPAQASDFSTLPILHDGRLKPVDSFARIHLKLFSGNEHVDNMNAEDWLLDTLFNPADSFERPVFKITSPELLNLLRIKKTRSNLYSLADIAPGLDALNPVIVTLLQKPDEELSKGQKALLDLHTNRILYTQILRSFSMLMPLTITPPESLSAKEKDIYSALDLQKARRTAQQKLKSIQSQKGNEFGQYTDEELDIARFVQQMNILESAAQNNVLFRVIPPQSKDSEFWLSPWEALEIEYTDHTLDEWKAAITAYKNDDQDAMNNAFRSLSKVVSGLSRAQLQAEVFYNRIKPFSVALFFFAVCAFTIATYAIKQKSKLYKAAWISFALAFAAIALGLALRIFILGRPPVSTLYESVLFVTFITAGLSLLTEYKFKNGLSLFGGSMIAFLLIAISGPLAVNPDDKEVLVAVLDTNFWLATHVLIITAGYAACILTALAAHLSLGWIAWKSQSNATLNAFIHSSALLSLMLMSVGTILGGIWADQSWGRFWGWDPKENGALLIILWLIWVLHGKLSGHFKKTDAQALLAGLGIVVALSWFGVNLLSIGLHSYGFIDGIAYGLISFCAIEIALIGGAYTLIKKREAACARTS